jgi:acetoacetyl-CoA synthetase
MTAPVAEGTLLWEPSAQLMRTSTMTRYIAWLSDHRQLHFDTYDALWQWSVRDLGAFWTSVWDFFGVVASQSAAHPLAGRGMPGAQWFVGAELNYAEQVFARARDTEPALLFQSEREPLASVSWAELRCEVARVAAALRALGVARGDRVAAYLPNIPEAVIAFLACASLGAVWSSCPPEFGAHAVVDRFAQIAPKVLLTVDGYQYGGKAFDRRAVVAEALRALPSVEHVILVPYLDRAARLECATPALRWDDLPAGAATPTFAQLPFDHPLWILYSSGTTGMPKAMVHGHGGIILEHLKSLGLHMNVGERDRLFWFTTTGWMMWNLLVGGLLVGATVVLYDGSPAYPTLGALWELAARARISAFGTSASYLGACEKAGLQPGAEHDLSALVSLGATGSPLPPAGYAWVYEHVKHDVWLATKSGGTDVCSAFLTCCPLLPVRAGELQCRALGVDAQAWDDAGRPLIDEVGELVITQPMPSMPLCFWGDPGDARYRDSYFGMFPGVWRHGDWVKLTRAGSAVIYGRSDATINRFGVRIGSGDIYRAVEALPEVAESLVVGVERPGGDYYLPMFLVPRAGYALTDALRAAIRAQIATVVSPRHVPDEIVAVPAIPRTLNGKKLEVPVKKLLMGVPLEQAVGAGVVANPESLGFFVEFAQAHGPAGR